MTKKKDAVVAKLLFKFVALLYSSGSELWSAHGSCSSYQLKTEERLGACS